MLRNILYKDQYNVSLQHNSFMNTICKFFCSTPDRVVFLNQKIFFMSLMSFHRLLDPLRPLNPSSASLKQEPHAQV